MERVHPQQDGQGHAQDVLSQDQANGCNGDPDAHLSTLFDQCPGGCQADPCEENIHEPLLQDGDLKVDGQQTGATQDPEDEADHQTGHDHTGDTVGLEKIDALYDPAAHHGHQRGQRGALHHIKADFQHKRTTSFNGSTHIGTAAYCRIVMAAGAMDGSMAPPKGPGF